MNNQETFEDPGVIRVYTAVFSPVDAATLQRVRDHLTRAVRTTPAPGIVAASQEVLATPRQRSVANGRGRMGRGRLLLVLSLAALMGIPAAAYAASSLLGDIMPNRHGAAIQQFRQQHRYRSFTFVEQSIPPGMISAKQAIDTAIPETVGATTNGRLKPSVRVTARFGQYSSTLFMPRPVWVVTFSGPSVTIYSHGSTTTVGHEEMLIIDGKTGRYLEARVGNRP